MNLEEDFDSLPIEKQVSIMKHRALRRHRQGGYDLLCMSGQEPRLAQRNMTFHDCVNSTLTN